MREENYRRSQRKKGSSDSKQGSEGFLEQGEIVDRLEPKSRTV
jgi:hypothetical protein